MYTCPMTNGRRLWPPRPANKGVAEAVSGPPKEYEQFFGTSYRPHAIDSLRSLLGALTVFLYYPGNQKEQMTKKIGRSGSSISCATWKLRNVGNSKPHIEKQVSRNTVPSQVAKKCMHPRLRKCEFPSPGFNSCCFSDGLLILFLAAPHTAWVYHTMPSAAIFDRAGAAKKWLMMACAALISRMA